MPRRPGSAGRPPSRRAPAVSSKPPLPVPLEVDPLAALLRQLAGLTGSPRASRWAAALLAAGESATSAGGRQEGVVRAASAATP
jgi:hypothetical protein